MDIVRDVKAQILDETSFERYLDEGKTVFIGNGVSKFENICNHANAVFMNDKLPSAKGMAAMVEAKYEIGDTEDVAYFEPFYLKDFILG